MKKRITFTFDTETIELLKELSGKTRIPQARLAEDAIRDMMKREASK